MWATDDGSVDVGRVECCRRWPIRGATTSHGLPYDADRSLPHWLGHSSLGCFIVRYTFVLPPPRPESIPLPCFGRAFSYSPATPAKKNRTRRRAIDHRGCIPGAEIWGCVGDSVCVVNTPGFLWHFCAHLSQPVRPSPAAVRTWDSLPPRHPSLSDAALSAATRLVARTPRRAKKQAYFRRITALRPSGFRSVCLRCGWAPSPR